MIWVLEIDLERKNLDTGMGKNYHRSLFWNSGHIMSHRYYHG
jgi:hypothetical protein